MKNPISRFRRALLEAASRHPLHLAAAVTMAVGTLSLLPSASVAQSKSGAVAGGTGSGAVAGGTGSGAVAGGTGSGAVAGGTRSGAVAGGTGSGAVAGGTRSGAVAGGTRSGAVAGGTRSGAVTVGTGSRAAHGIGGGASAATKRQYFGGNGGANGDSLSERGGGRNTNDTSGTNGAISQGNVYGDTLSERGGGRNTNDTSGIGGGPGTVNAPAARTRNNGATNGRRGYYDRSGVWVGGLGVGGVGVGGVGYVDDGYYDDGVAVGTASAQTTDSVTTGRNVVPPAAHTPKKVITDLDRANAQRDDATDRSNNVFSGNEGNLKAEDAVADELAAEREGTRAVDDHGDAPTPRSATGATREIAPPLRDGAPGGSGRDAAPVIAAGDRAAEIDRLKNRSTRGVARSLDRYPVRDAGSLPAGDARSTSRTKRKPIEADDSGRTRAAPGQTGAFVDRKDESPVEVKVSAPE